MKHLIRAALFDLDGVLAFTDKYHYVAWKRLADEQGWAFDEKLNHQLRGVSRLPALDIILKHNAVSLTEREKAQLAHRKNEYYKELLGSINAADLYPGAVDFLSKLRSQGIKLALCSASKNAMTVLERLDLVPSFDVIVTGHDFQRPKPDPEIFLLAANKLGVPPFHCVVFEDAPAGVEAGLAAGMKVIGVGSREVLPNASEVIDRYDQIDLAALLDTGRPATVTPEPWTVAETVVNPRRAGYWESILALTNGLLGLRGTYEEDDEALTDHAYPGMFVNGIYDYEPYHHVVSFPGYPPHRHVMLNLCDWRIINLYLDGEPFSMFRGQVSNYRRELDMRRGIVVRSLVWQSPAGKRVRIRTTRLVSMVRRHSAAIRYEVTPLGSPARITLESMTRCKVPSGELKGDHLRVLDRRSQGRLRAFLSKPKTADFRVGAAVTHHLTAPHDEDATIDTQETGDAFVDRFTVQAADGATIVLDKHACFFTSIETAAKEVLDSAITGVQRDRADGFDQLLAEQADFWQRYWDLADIEIDGHVADQQALRFAMFHLRQSHPEDDRRSISACGMTGDHYWGHVFWDTEMYIAPLFLYTQPELLRPLLMYRYHLLDRARQRAREMAGIGALYAWNSISGEECGIIYEAATAEYHLVSDIALAIHRYVSATDDTEFLFNHGAEVLFETARFLADRGKFIPLRENKFCINVVCGPDEYGCGINNNCYTNMLAQWHFRFAAGVYDRMQTECPDRFTHLTERISLGPDERQLWRRAADNMYIPYHDQLGIHQQDDSFLYLDPVDMGRLPLHTDLRNFTHPLNLWRMQVAKQPDVVLLMLVLSDRFTLAQKRANYEYYEPRTNHGSSLSTSIHSIIASEIGRPHDAYAYFRHSAFMDLHDFKDNTAGGVHSACLGGTWMAVVHGFAGMRDNDTAPRDRDTGGGPPPLEVADAMMKTHGSSCPRDHDTAPRDHDTAPRDDDTLPGDHDTGLVLNPTLPPAWRSYRFKLHYRARLLEITVKPDQTTFRLLSGPPLRFHAACEPIALSPANPTATIPTH